MYSCSFGKPFSRLRGASGAAPNFIPAVGWADSIEKSANFGSYLPLQKAGRCICSDRQTAQRRNDATEQLHDDPPI